MLQINCVIFLAAVRGQKYFSLVKLKLTKSHIDGYRAGSHGALEWL